MDAPNGGAAITEIDLYDEAAITEITPCGGAAITGRAIEGSRGRS
jgi:hypothetical protein